MRWGQQSRAGNASLLGSAPAHCRRFKGHAAACDWLRQSPLHDFIRDTIVLRGHMPHKVLYNLFRTIDEHGHIIDVYLSDRRNTAAARRYFEGALDTSGAAPMRVTSDKVKWICPR
jgi:hypothetical protein